jgi:hypothetical protein
MRLLLRANAHRALDDTSLEIAASPDTPDRERWQWHVRLHATPTAGDGTTVTAPVVLQDGSTGTLEVNADPRRISAAIQVLPVETHLELDRAEPELVVLLVVGGAALVEGRHLLAERDALVLQGDDPLRVGIDAATGCVSAAVVRLRPLHDRVLAWVP